MLHTKAQRCTSPKATGAPTPLDRVGGGALLHSPHGDRGAEPADLAWLTASWGRSAVQESGFLGRISRGGGLEVSSQSPQVGGGKLRPRGPPLGAGQSAEGQPVCPPPLLPARFWRRGAVTRLRLWGAGARVRCAPAPRPRVPHHCAARARRPLCCCRCSSPRWPPPLLPPGPGASPPGALRVRPGRPCPEGVGERQGSGIFTPV